MGGPHDAAVLQLWHLHSDGAAAKQPPLLFPVDARVLSRSRKLVWRSSGFLKSGSPIVASEATVDATGSEKVFFSPWVPLPTMWCCLALKREACFFRKYLAAVPEPCTVHALERQFFHLRQTDSFCVAPPST